KGEFPEFLFQVLEEPVQGQGDHIFRIGFQGFRRPKNDLSATFDDQTALDLRADLKIIRGKFLVEFITVQELGQDNVHGCGNRTVSLGVVTDVILELKEVVHVPGGRLFFTGNGDQKKGDGKQW